MIKVTIKSQNHSIKEIQVLGHADSNEYGKDLVCAGVTTCCVGIANSLDQYHFLDQHMGTIDLKEGFFEIKVNHCDEKIQVVLETLVTILETIEESQSQYMKITKMEV